jgi:hypothetical protein
MPAANSLHHCFQVRSLEPFTDARKENGRAMSKLTAWMERPLWGDSEAAE